MSLLFSREGEYSIQALCYIALKPVGELVGNRELTDKLGIPYFFLGKILQKLVRRGYLLSRKGPNGGFALAVQPDRITLYDIKDAIDGIEDLSTCALGFKGCSNENRCAVHHEWKILREGITLMLRNRDILSVARESTRGELQIP
jgi:Rrf2 family protein